MSKRIRPPVRKSQRWKRLKNQFLNVVGNPFNMVVFFSLLILFCLIIIPLLTMLTNTFTVAKAELRNLPDAQIGDFTLFYWKYLLASPLTETILWEPLLNSLLIGFFVTVISVPLGAVMAWLMVRTDIPGKKLLGMLIIVPYMIPSWCKALSWLSVFRNSTSGSLGLLTGMGVAVPDWLAYGPFAIIVVLVIHYYAYAYLLVSSALSSINSELEEMGEILGAGKARILAKITFPLVMPAILSAVIMTFSKAMGTFGVPSVLGLKIGYYTVSTTMYNSIQNGQNQVGYVISLILILIASLSVFMNQKAIGSRKSYSTIGGKGGRTNPIRLGKWRPIVTGILFVFVAAAVVFPVLVLLYQSLMLEPGNYSLSNLTLHYWIGDSVPTIDQGEPGIFKNPQFLKYIGNTIKLVILTSLFATVFGQMIGYINSRGRKLFSGKLVEQLVFIPYLIPSIAFGAMYLALFATAKKIELFGYRITLIPSLYGTFTILVLIAVVKNMPFASRAGTSNMLQISTELEEAAQVENAGFFRRFFKIVFPLSKGGMISGFMLVFISIMKELDLIVILMTPSQQTLPYMAYAYSAENLIQLSSAVTIVMFVLVFFVYWFANTFTDADITKGF